LLTKITLSLHHVTDPGTGWLPDPDGVDIGINYPNLEPDGFTVILTAIGDPWQDPDKTNTIKIVVGDVGDGILDSWVLLESGTFSCVDITDAPSISQKPSSGECSTSFSFSFFRSKFKMILSNSI
jgi:hypothetical protein